MKRFICMIVLVASCAGLSAQQVDLYFPHFAGAEYNLVLFRGIRPDTVAQGKIAIDGRLKLILPENDKDYTGMARWNLKAGGGLSFILDGSDFSISCAEAAPTEQSIIYKGSKENDFLRTYFSEQQLLLQRISALQILQQAYKEDAGNALYPLLRPELAKEEASFEASVKELRQSPLYAAHYVRISDFYQGMPLYNVAKESDGPGQLAAMRRFVAEELDMDILYTSGMWSEAISLCFELFPDRAEFGEAMVGLLKRTKTQKVFEQFSHDLITITEQYDWQAAGEKIVAYLSESNRFTYPIARIENAIAVYKTKAGTPAPELSVASIAKGKFLLVFYETGCGSCDTEMQELRKHYPVLKEKGYEVISLSADNDPAIFQNNARHFPWEHKYCDGEGFDGPDFKNYSVIGTPTIYVIENGIFQGRYARLQDTGILK